MNSKAYKSYEISKNEYRELKYFCLRYREMRRHEDKQTIDCALEQAAENEIIRAYLRRSVTENVRFDCLDVPMGKNQFYELRRKFFYILHELKNR